MTESVVKIFDDFPNCGRYTDYDSSEQDFKQRKPLP